MPMELTSQLLNQPYAFVIASIALFLFGLIPGLPHFPFFLLSVLTGGIAYYRLKDIQTEEAQSIKKLDEEARAPVPERVESILPLDIMELEVGYELIPLVDAMGNPLGDVLVEREDLDTTFTTSLVLNF